MEAADAAAGDLDHLDGPRRVAAVRIDAVLAERCASVGCGRNQSRSLTTDATAEQPRADVVGPLDPHREGWHGLHCVFLEQGHEASNVVAFERVDVLRE